MDALTFKPILPQDLSIDALQPLHDALDPDFSDRLIEIAEIIFTGLLASPAKDLPGADRANIAIAVLLQFCTVINGQSYYFNSLENLRSTRLKREIKKNFKGNNHGALARQYGITEVRVYQILKGKIK